MKTWRINYSRLIAELFFILKQTYSLTKLIKYYKNGDNGKNRLRIYVALYTRVLENHIGFTKKLSEKLSTIE